jgi:YbbR domain-containing protein
MVYGDIRFDPDSVVLRGPEDVLENISYVTLGLLDDKNLEKTTQKDLPVMLDRQYDYITARPDEVRVTIPVEKFTEGNIEVPVSIIADTSIQIRLFPDAVKISYLVALKDYPQVTPGMFKAVANFNDIDIEKEKEVRIRVTESPSTIKMTRIEPEKAEFIIKK